MRRPCPAGPACGLRRRLSLRYAARAMTREEEHLNLLALFHFILGGLTAFGACIPFIHLGLGLAMVGGAFPEQNGPPPAIGWLFVVFGTFAILIGWTLAILMIAAGRRLKARRSRTFCFVVAALCCTMMPFGTVLGIFTILVLSKEPVKAMFAANDGKTA